MDLIEERSPQEKLIIAKTLIESVLDELPSAQPEIIRCKDCKNAPKCYGDVVMRSKGGGNIYCPLTYCSEAERRTDESD